MNSKSNLPSEKSEVSETLPINNFYVSTDNNENDTFPSNDSSCNTNPGNVDDHVSSGYSSDASNPVNILKSLKSKNTEKIVIAQLNINSLPHKFDQLVTIIDGNVDILVITETKLDETYTNSQFKIDGFSSPYRLDRNREGGGIIVFIREDIPSKILTKHTLPEDIEAILIEINLRKNKFMLLATYHPPSQSDQYFFDNINTALDRYAGNYDKVLLGRRF